MDAIIEAIQPELDAQSARMRNYFDDTFANRATSDGIARWEAILGITPDPSTETLQFRRERVLNRLRNTTPFTERALQGLMDNIMGVGGWSYDLDPVNCTLDIIGTRPGGNWLNEMTLTLDSIIPANIAWTLNLYSTTWQSVYEKYGSWEDVYNGNATWQDVMEGI